MTPKSILAFGDVHFPVHDPIAVRTMLRFAQAVKPESVVCVGDYYDCWSVSSHPKEPERMATGALQAEFDAGAKLWADLCKVAKEVHFILGNHENRIARHVLNNAGLYGLKAMSWKVLAQLPDKVRVHPYGTRLSIGDFSFEHGDKVGGKYGTKFAANWQLEKRGMRNSVFGHTHRSEMRYRTVYDTEGLAKTCVAINQGHLSDTAQQTYAYEPDWQQGFTYLEKGSSDSYQAHPMVIKDGSVTYSGKTYSGGQQ